MENLDAKGAGNAPIYELFRSEWANRLTRVVVRDTGSDIPDNQLEKNVQSFRWLEAPRSQTIGGAEEGWRSFASNGIEWLGGGAGKPRAARLGAVPEIRC